MDMQSALKALETMGQDNFVGSSDRFVATAVEWLGRQGMVSIVWSDDAWVIQSENFATGEVEDVTLADALSRAVHACQDALKAAEAREGETMENKALGFLIKAVARVRSRYPEDVFPGEVSEGKTEDDRRCRASAEMARLTCDNILKEAHEIAEAREAE